MIREAIQSALKIVRPWKIKSRTVKSEDYKQGWNDCVREFDKNRKKLEKFMNQY